VTVGGPASAGSGPQPTNPEIKRRRRIRPHLLSVGALMVGFIVTAALVVVSAVTYNHNENRLLGLRVQDAGALIAEDLPSIETPLGSATELAEATNGDPSRFETFMRAYIGQGGAVSASLWTVTGGVATIVAFAGQPPLLQSMSPKADAYFSRALHSRQLAVIEVTSGNTEHVGFAYSPGDTAFITYEEHSLLANRQARVASNSAFANLDYAIYIGRTIDTRDLLTTDTTHLPITGRRASVVVPFGEDAFRLVMTPTVSLGGTFSERLSWMVGIVGVLVSLGAMFLVERLVRRRKFAEGIALVLDEVAGENQRLYNEQHTIATTLQKALLPQELPELEGVEFGARYIAGGAGMDIGGDWYDVVKIDDRRFLVVVGDVSGRGLRAATVMAELRYAIRAYAAAGDDPRQILTNLSQLHNLESDGHFATVLCAQVDLVLNEVTFVNAGHLPPVLIDESGCVLVDTPTGVPIGVPGGGPYEPFRVGVSSSGTLLAFTDGLVERRGQLIDVALGHLTETAGRTTGSLSDLLDRVLVEFEGKRGFEDDTALLGVRWMN
jgi:serine phosphatase RsbU (regulator of sigma subunit)